MADVKYDLLHQIHPSIRKYIMYIWKHGKTGVCAGVIQILKIASSVNKQEGIVAKYANKITLSIPYAGHYLEWEVKFCNDNMQFAPDFDLKDDEFLGELSVPIISKKLPSWSNWDPTNPSALHSVLMELLALYKKHQISLLEVERFSRLHFEFTSLSESAGIAKDDIEVLVEPSNVVHFLIALAIDFSCLPSDIFRNHNTDGKNVGTPSAVLMVTFSRIERCNVQPHLFISPAIEQTLLGVGYKHIPAFPNDGCLMDYVPAITHLLEDKIQFVVDSYMLKQKYIAHLLAEFPLNILEFDTINFSKAAFLFKTESMHWILLVTICPIFPKEKPKWVLRSIYHRYLHGPVMEILHDYPYSPRWKPEEMIPRAMKYTLDKVPQFLLKRSKVLHV